MRILFVDEILGQWVYERSIAQRKAQGASTLQLEIWECTSERDLCGRLEKNSTGFDVIASSFTPITRDVLSRLPHPPKVIVAQGTGRNHIDAAACEAAGAVVIDNAGWCASEVAEYLLFALGSLALNVKEVSKSMENGEWARNLADRKVVLRNKVLGIVGCGAIGQQLLRNARGVGMKVAFYDSYVKTFDGLESTKTLDGLLETADHLAVCIPLTSSTRGLLDIAALRKLKNGFLLVNAARGGVLCESALLEVLHDGTCAGAALDVFESEPLLSDSPLRNHPRIIVSPHIAGKARESEERAASAIVEKLSEFFGKLGEELGGYSTPVALGKNAFTSTKLSAARHASVGSATVVPSSVRTMRDIYDECCRGTGVVNLAAGMVELDPPLRLRQYASELALETQIHSGQPNLHMYRERNGDHSYRLAAQKLHRDFLALGAFPTDCVLAVNGVSAGVSSILFALRDSCQAKQTQRVWTVGVFVPYYTYHVEQIRSVFGGNVIIEYMKMTSDFCFDFDLIEKTLPELDAVIFTNPGNPSGRLMRNWEVKKWTGLAKEYPDCRIISDEVYADLTLDTGKFCSFTYPFPKNVFVVRGFSKSLCIGSWRLGYVLSSDPETLATVTRAHDVSCISCNWTQQAVARYILDSYDDYLHHICEWRNLLQENQAVIGKALSETLGWKALPAEGAMYMLVKHGMASDDEAFDLALQCGVAVCPGYMFFGSDSGFVRVHLAFSQKKAKHVASRLSQWSETHVSADSVTSDCVLR